MRARRRGRRPNSASMEAKSRRARIRRSQADVCLQVSGERGSCSVQSCRPLIFHVFLIMLLLDASKSSSHPSDVEQKIFQYIDHHQNTFVQSLSTWVAVESDSIQPHLRGNITEIVNIAANSLRALGATVELKNVSGQDETSSPDLSLPPVILAKLGNDAGKITVCFYGHLDVMPAKKEDGWKTDPYTLTEIDGKLYGRGTTDDKGPVLAWINAVGTFRALNMTLPVNLKFLLEGLEEAGSLGLEELLKENKGFFSDVTYIVISDNTWLSNKKPALTYGTRGNAAFIVEVECCKKDLHSGTYGGIVHEAMFDLVALLDSLVDSSGRILIPGIYKDVAKVTDEEMKLYGPIDFNYEEYKANIGVKEFRYKTKEDILLNMWRNPSLSIHGIEGAFSEPGIKTVIPSKVRGKFSIRQVPDMNLSTVESQVREHLKSVFSKRKSPNKLTVFMQVRAKPWIANIKDPPYEAARRAIKTVFQQDPDMIRDGSTIPVAKMFEDITKKSVMMFPLGAADDGEHSQNEKINRLNYINGTKVFASFLLEISKLHSASNR